MIEVAVAREDGWPEEFDWDALAERAVAAALEASPYGWIASGVSLLLMIYLVYTLLRPEKF